MSISRVAVLAAFVSLIVPVFVSAQTKLDSLPEGMKSLYQSVRRNLVEAAELMPEANYTFKPTPDVRSFGEIVGHVASAQFNFCAAARGVTNPNTQDNEKLATKAQLVQALKDSAAFCDPAYDLAPAALMAPAIFSGMAITKGYALTYNIAHDNEHYGNIVTYLRLKGLVPPSSARR